MRIGKNFAAGVANSFGAALISLIAVPFYIHFLGVEAYGLIGFFTALQSLLQLLDLGLEPSITRDMARYRIAGEIAKARHLLHTLATIYWLTGLLIAASVVLVAPWISRHWLHAEKLSQASVFSAVSLMGITIACRWPGALYLGALVGQERLIAASTISLGTSAVGSLGALAVLAFVSPTIQAFFIWQSIVGLGYALALRREAWSHVADASISRFDPEILRGIWRFSLGMSGVAITAVIMTQLDKVILSKIISLADFGKYMLATVVASGLYRFTVPLFNVVYPRFTGLVEKREMAKLTFVYRAGTHTFATLMFPLAMVLAIFAREFVQLWTRNARLAADVAPLIAILSVGAAIHSMMYFPYALQLANGMARLPLTINLLLLLTLVPLISTLAYLYGSLGGAIAWLLLSIFYLFLGTYFTHRHLLRGLGTRWLAVDVGIPLVMVLTIGVVTVTFTHRLDLSLPVKLLLAGVTGALAIICTRISSPYRLSDLRAALAE